MTQRRRIVFCLIFSSLLGSAAISLGQAAPLLPLHPATQVQVKQLMTVTHMAERMRDGMHKMIVQQQAAAPMFPPQFWSEFEVEMNKIDWIGVATPVYQKYMSEEDAAKAIAFYSTDAGQRSLDSSLAVSLELNAKGFELGKEAGARIGKKYAAQIEENMRKAQPSQMESPK